MVSKCANPACSASFHSLGEGRLFRLSSDDPRLHRQGTIVPDQKKPPRSVEFFWLCSICSKTLTIQVDGDRHVCTAPITRDAVESGLQADAG